MRGRFMLCWSQYAVYLFFFPLCLPRPLSTYSWITGSKAFSGQGMALGSTTESGSGGGGMSGSELQDRREKTRAARLARLGVS